MQDAMPVNEELDQSGGARRPDPGSPTARLVAWLLLIPLLGGVLALQHLEEPPKPPESLVTPPTAVDPYAVMAKLEAKLWHATVQAGQKDPKLPGAFMDNLDKSAHTPLDRLRGAVVAGEMVGESEARARLAGVEDELKQVQPKAGPDDPGYSAEDLELMRESIRKLNAIYQGGGEQAISEDDKRFLVDHHGWFGRLALMHGRPDTDPVRSMILGGGAVIMLLLVVVVLGGLAVVVTGLVLLIIAVINYASGKIRPAFVPPAPGGSVYLETAAAFLASFLALKVVTSAIEAFFGGAPWLNAVHLALQWAILPVIAWPVLRGVSWERLRADMGWHPGRGVWREVGAGFAGYLAGVPIFLAGVLISLTAIIVREAIRQMSAPGAPSEPPGNPILDVVGGGSPLILLMLYTLASIWAPIVEEAVFRGAFYRHLRARLPVVIAAAFTGLIFAAMHGYDVLMLGPVFALGFNFALLREWRGSLIAPMVAHALHNGVLLAFAILFIGVLGK